MSGIGANVFIIDTGISDISGIVVFYASNEGGNKWETDDNNISDIYTYPDISNASEAKGYFIPYDSQISIILTAGTAGPNDFIRFYLVPSSSVASFSTGNPIDITLLKSLLYNNGETYFTANNTYMDGSVPSLTSVTTTPPAEPTPITTATLPIISSYTPAQVNSLFNIRDEGQRVVETKSEQTIAAEVKKYLNTNGALPQFKNYGDYLAYKNAINLQNGLLQRYG